MTRVECVAACYMLTCEHAYKLGLSSELLGALTASVNKLEDRTPNSILMPMMATKFYVKTVVKVRKAGTFPSEYHPDSTKVFHHKVMQTINPPSLCGR